MNNIKIRNLYFIRHSASIKSIEDRHGGKGKPLTDQGKLDAIEVSRFLEKHERLDRTVAKIYASLLPQVHETASIISDHLKTPVVYDERLMNIDLGVLSGLSKKEAMQRFPEPAKQLEDWRKGNIPISRVKIPGAETTQDLFLRISSFIYDLFEKDDVSMLILIATRSVGVMVSNILNGYDGKPTSKFKRHLFDPSSITKFEIISRSSSQQLFRNKTDFLPFPPKYPDF